jgi:hypothetical protein
VNPKDRTPLVAAVGLAVVALAGVAMDYLSWPIAVFLLAASGGGFYWLRRRAADAAAADAEPAGPVIAGGLRMVDKPLRSTKPRLSHALRVTVSTEVSVSLGLRVVCDVPIPEVEALAQTGRRAGARQGVPQFVRESPQAWLFVVRNSPGQRELFLRVDLYAAQPIHVVQVDQIRSGLKVVLPEWKEFEQTLGAESEAPAGGPEAPATGEAGTLAAGVAAPAGGLETAAGDPETAGGGHPAPPANEPTP